MSEPVSAQAQSPRPRVGLLALIVALLLLVIAGGTIGVLVLTKKSNPATSGAPANSPLSFSNANGTVNILDSQTGHSDKIQILVNGLPKLTDGSHYAAWLLDDQSGRNVGLGNLAAGNGSFSLDFTNANGSVLSMGDKVEVTLEKGNSNGPSGKVILEAAFPTKAMTYIKTLLLSYNLTPNKIGLMVGALQQIQRMDTLAEGLKQTGGNTQSVTCAAQDLIDITEGAQGSHYKTSTSNCVINMEAGDGYGLLGAHGYLAQITQQASLAANQSDATDSIRAHNRHVAICIQNVVNWTTTIDADAQALIQNPADSGKINEIATLANKAFKGDDGNDDPIPGVSGIKTAYFHTQLMAALVLAPTE